MGVKQPRFVDWLMTNFPGSFRAINFRERYKGVPHSLCPRSYASQLTPTSHPYRAYFDTVYLDINPLIHNSIRSSKSEKIFLERFFCMLDKVLAQSVPVRMCYFAIDGPGPLAKLLEQRKRREKTKQEKPNTLSTLQITPGCSFMERMETYLGYYTCRYLQQYQHSPNLRFVIDGAASPGEGEAKIIQNLSEYSNLIKGACAIVTSDSDAILQAIASGIPRLFIIRKNQTEQHRCLSIDHLVAQLETRFPGQGPRVRLDFVLLAMMCGNDYLAKVRYLNMDRLWSHYIRLKNGKGKGPSAARYKNMFLVDTERKTINLDMIKGLMGKMMLYGYDTRGENEPVEPRKNGREVVHEMMKEGVVEEEEEVKGRGRGRSGRYSGLERVGGERRGGADKRDGACGADKRGHVDVR
ncbi:hypothetical protein BC937DRAFT_94498, partial [Endogone sp. FLAS-F59071]